MFLQSPGGALLQHGVDDFLVAVQEDLQLCRVKAVLPVAELRIPAALVAHDLHMERQGIKLQMDGLRGRAADLIDVDDVALILEEHLALSRDGDEVLHRVHDLLAGPLQEIDGGLVRKDLVSAVIGQEQRARDPSPAAVGTSAVDAVREDIVLVGEQHGAVIEGSQEQDVLGNTVLTAEILDLLFHQPVELLPDDVLLRVGEIHPFLPVQDTAGNTAALQQVVVILNVLLPDACRGALLIVHDVVVEGVGLALDLLARIALVDILQKDVHGNTVTHDVRDVEEHVLRGLGLIEGDVEELIFSVESEGLEQAVLHCRPLFVRDLDDRDVDLPLVVAVQHELLSVEADDALEARMRFDHVLDGCLQPRKVHGLVQFEGEGQVSGGVARDDVCEVLLHRRQRIDLPHRIGLRRLLSCAALDQLLQLHDTAVLQQLVECDGESHPGADVLDQHDAAQGIQAVLVEIVAHADGVVSEHRGDDLEELFLDLGLRRLALRGLCLLRLLLLARKVLAADDLPGGSLLEGVLPDDHIRDPGVGRKSVADHTDLFLHCSGNILDLLRVGVLIVRIDCRRDPVILLVDQDIADQRISVEEVLDGLRGNVLAVLQDDEVLLPARQVQEALPVHISEVAGAEPAVLREALAGPLRIIIITHHDGGTLHADLAVHDLHMAVADHLSH